MTGIRYFEEVEGSLNPYPAGNESDKPLPQTRTGLFHLRDSAGEGFLFPVVMHLLYKQGKC